MRTVSTGGCYLTPDIAIKLAAGRQDPLTKRERQVAEKLAQGMSVKVGAGETQAHWRLADAAAVRTWLQHLAYDAQTERRDDHESFSRSL